MDFSVFSHGQIHSKLWLCEQLEPYLPNDARVIILGSWYNTLGFLLLVRNSHKLELLTGIDFENENIKMSNKLLDAWLIGNDVKVKNIWKSANRLTEQDTEIYHIVINTSCEHMEDEWFNQVNLDQLICLQTSNVVHDHVTWDIINPNPDMETFKSKYPLSQILYEGEKVFDYGELKYSRYMLIGRK